MNYRLMKQYGHLANPLSPSMSTWFMKAPREGDNQSIKAFVQKSCARLFYNVVLSMHFHGLLTVSIELLDRCNTVVFFRQKYPVYDYIHLRYKVKKCFFYLTQTVNFAIKTTFHYLGTISDFFTSFFVKLKVYIGKNFLENFIKKPLNYSRFFILHHKCTTVLRWNTIIATCTMLYGGT